MARRESAARVTPDRRWPERQRSVLSTILVLICASAVASGVPSRAADPSGLRLAGERVRFDAGLTPQFTDNQLKRTSQATRDGLVRWVATEHGRQLIRYFKAPEYEIEVIEDLTEAGLGRAPQPGMATLVAFGDHATVKSYELILNPNPWVTTPKGMTLMPGQPSTAAEVLSTAWAGEMLHIYFYSQGISLPHHQRPDFQQEWHVVAAELGFPYLPHGDRDDRGGRRRVRVAR